MGKILHFGQSARDSLRRGINTLTRAVGVTLGPTGRNVVLDVRWKGPTIVGDGFTIARELDLPNPTEDLGVTLITEAAKKVYENCGDGTTTTIVLATAIINEANVNLAAGANPVGLIKGIKRASTAILEELESASIALDDQDQIFQVATMASKDREIGELLVEAVNFAGKEGVIIVESADSTYSRLESIEGLEFDSGLISPHFVTDNEKMEAVIEKPHILITEVELSAIEDILPALERIIPITKTLVIICGNADGEALAGLIMNKQRGNLDVMAVKAPGLGGRRRERLIDIAIATGGTLLPDEETGRTLRSVTEDDLGQADKVVSNEKMTTILGGDGDSKEIASRIRQLKGEDKEAQTAQYRQQLQERQGALTGKTAVLEVGGFTESEIKEKKIRVENAVAAVQLAITGGILPGGGVSLVDASSALDSLEATGDEATGVRIMGLAALAPVHFIAYNAGKKNSVIVEKILQGPNGYGFNAETDEFGDMLDMGIIDPTMLIKESLTNAVSIATSIISVDATIVHTPEKGPMGEKLDMSAKYE